MRDHRWRQKDFYSNALQAIAETSLDVMSFTSMALEFHVSLELARRIKAEDPGVVTFLGGPHFTSTFEEVLEPYSWTDYVIVGKGEIATCSLLRYLQGKPLRASECGSALEVVWYWSDC